MPTKAISAQESELVFNMKEFSDPEHLTPIVIDGIENTLYIQFADQEEALRKLIEKESIILTDISEKYHIESLDESNWEKYYYAIEEYFSDEDQIILDRDYHYVVLSYFFDIYENKGKNDEIIKIYNSDNISWDEKSYELLGLLPCDDPFVEANTEPQVLVVTSYNRSNAITYATNHATNRAGLALYYSYTQDCTNFASQILEAGGEPQNNTGSVYSGWWHTVTIGGTMSNPTFTHNNSRSFTTVSYFNSYFGTYYTTTTHANFASNLQAGSVIACDTSGDGDMNHIGFVTEIGSYNSSIGCIDYKVAQHTGDYHRWVSASNNSWELMSKWRIIIH